MGTRGLMLAAWPADLRTRCDWSTVKPHVRQGLGRLLSWARARQRDPLNTDTIRAFVDDLRRTCSVGRAEQILGGLSLALMRARPEERWDWIKEIQRELGRQDRRAHGRRAASRHGRQRTLTVSIECWPPEVRNAWRAAISDGTVAAAYAEFVDDEGPLAHWAPASKKKAENGYARFLGWAIQTGAGPSVTPKAVGRFVNALEAQRCSPATVASYAEGVLTLMRVAQPETDWQWLSEQLNRLKTAARHGPRRKDGRVVHAAELFDLGLRLMERASRRRPELARTAVLFRDGLLFVVLAMAPARAASFLRIRVGAHLDLESVVGALTWSGDETKEKRPEHYPLWDTVRALIEEYVQVYRPVLAGGYTGAELWLAENGRGPLGYAGFRRAIVVRSTAHLGIAVSPHLVRDSVALTISEDAPGSMELATILLHHASARSTVAYRHQASTIAASRIARGLHDRARDRAKRRIRAAAVDRTSGESDPVFTRFV